MPGTAELARDLVQVAELCLSRGMALRPAERAEVEAALLRAREALAGEPWRDPLIELLNMLRTECERRGIQVFHDGRVRAGAAAALLGICPGTLSNWVSQGRGPRPVKSGGRNFYMLADIARNLHETSSKAPRARGSL